ncbi:MAG: CAP domain-containing protein [Pseudomonadota bacterium]|nr:CAP domain-containing protein [Pseudomonadota bacterium]
MELVSLALFLTGPALAEGLGGAGYGVPVDGFPTQAERQLLLWTNAARVAPEEFENEYQGAGCSYDDFEPGEQSPKAPLYIDLDLTEVSRWHSEQMEQNDCFQHESCDGSNEDFGTRVARYYTETGYIGENIAMGVADARYAVMSMWMCSSGHRANIQSADYNEMGPGVSGVYLTQDFAAGTLGEGTPPVRMAVDDGSGTWRADWGDTDAPVTLELVIDGVEADMVLAFGAPELGIYSLAIEAAEPAGETDAAEGCRGWYVYWETAAGATGTFPEEGSWLVGDCDGEDWEPLQAPKGGLFGDIPEEDLEGAMMDDLALVGCAAAPIGPAHGAFGAVGVLVALAGLRRRRTEA